MGRYEQRLLSEEEWGKLLVACKYGDTREAIDALYIGEGIVCQSDELNVTLITIQVSLNQKFYRYKLPYWVRLIPGELTRDRTGKKVILANPRVVLMCLKPPSSASVPQTAA